MLYVRTINGKQEFSNCKTIQTLEGIWISNPSPEQIESAGWIEYIPPTPIDEEEPITEPDSYEIMMAVKKMLSSTIDSLSDEEALSVAALYPTWISVLGKTIGIGERYWYDGKLYKVIQQHTVQENWTPDVSISLFTEVTIEEWPEWRQPGGAQDAYMIGDKVTFNGLHYVSLLDNNVWSPETLPSAWRSES